MLFTKLAQSDARKYICTFSQKNSHIVLSRTNEEYSPSVRRILRVVSRDF